MIIEIAPPERHHHSHASHGYYFSHLWNMGLMGQAAAPEGLLV